MYHGWFIALSELSIVALGTAIIKNSYFKKFKTVPYYWLAFTMMTGVWEMSYVLDYDKTCNYSNELINTNRHTWENVYDISYLLPTKFSKIFYGEYGAYADRYYMDLTTTWSRTIETTHLVLCSLFSLLTFIFYKMGHTDKFICSYCIAMGGQLMNSILYMVNYFIQITDSNTVNYNTAEFPTGKFLSKRPFIYINVLWLIMPSILIYDILEIKNKIMYTVIDNEEEDL